MVVEEAAVESVGELEVGGGGGGGGRGEDRGENLVVGEGQFRHFDRARRSSSVEWKWNFLGVLV